MICITSLCSQQLITTENEFTMKHSKMALAFLLITSTLLSCKKGSDYTAPAPQEKKVVRYQSMDNSGTYMTTIQYNENGRMSRIDYGNSFEEVTYTGALTATVKSAMKSSPDQFTTENWTLNDKGSIVKREVVKTNGNNEIIEYTYNADGIIVKSNRYNMMGGNTYVNEYDVENGVIAGQRYLVNGVLVNSYIMEYDYSKTTRGFNSVYWSYPAPGLNGASLRHPLTSVKIYNSAGVLESHRTVNAEMDGENYPRKITYTNVATGGVYQFTFFYE